MGKQDFYLRLTKSYTKAHPDLSKQVIQNRVNSIWNEHKKRKDLPDVMKKLTDEYDQKFKAREAKIRQLWLSVPKKTNTTGGNDSTIPTVRLVADDIPNSTDTLPAVQIVANDVQSSADAIPAVQIVADDIQSSADAIHDTSSDTSKNNLEQSIVSQDVRRPAQELINKRIVLVSADLCGLYQRQNLDMLTSEQFKELKSKEQQKKQLQSKLNIRIRDQSRQKRRRAIARRKIEKLMSTVNPDNENFIKLRATSGRPRIECDQPLLLRAIRDIAIHGSGAHERRRCEVLRSVRTLDELLAEVQRQGFQISRSGLYLRLIPRNHLTTEGKRHVNTVPVKLIGAQNDKHESHIDGQFCTSTIRNLEELASLLGPKEVFFLSQDDKAKVAIGVTAAKKQSPMLMHLEYKVTLPDHDFVVAAKHKLTPSVYAGIVIKPNGFGKPESVTYSGPTYIAIRSGKHSSSTAFSHAKDFGTVLQMPEFRPFTHFKDDVKPIVIVITDGGPDESPRFQNVVNVAISHFNKFNLDAIFLATNAPGRSAYNRVERRMAALSRELAGVVLPHNHFGNHLNAQKDTIDEDLELKNFRYAGDALADLLSKVVIDKFDTKAEYVDPEQSSIEETSIISKDWIWISNHVSTSQYFTQIIKCTDRNCCSAPRSSYFRIFKDRQQFLPAPIPLEQTDAGVVASNEYKDFASLFVLKSLDFSEMMKDKDFDVMPYDMYCPSIQSSLKARICKKCGKYFASLVMLKAHNKFVHDDNTLSVPKIRPVRIAAQRAREFMAVIALNENNDLDVEWVDEDNIEPECMLNRICQERNESFAMPVHSIADHFKCPWRDV